MIMLSGIISSTVKIKKDLFFHQKYITIVFNTVISIFFLFYYVLRKSLGLFFIGLNYYKNLLASLQKQ